MRRLFLVLIVGALAACSATVPKVDDPAKLVSECEPLISSQPSHAVDPGKWPPELVKLHPVEVRCDQGVLIITTFQETGVGVRGFIIAARPPALDHYVITRSEAPELYTFTFQP